MVMEYIYLATGCTVVGVVMTYVVLEVCQILGVSIERNVWVVGIPAVFSLILNVTLLELYRKFKRKKNSVSSSSKERGRFFAQA